MILLELWKNPGVIKMSGYIDSDYEMKDGLIRDLAETGAIKINLDNPFELTSGNRSPVYFDCRKLISYPETIKDITESFCSKIVRFDYDVDVVAGGATGGIPYASFVAYELGKPMVYVRKSPKGKGLFSQIEGNFERGSNVVLIEDLITNAGSKINFINGIERAGGNVKDCLVVFDRQQGGEEALSNLMVLDGEMEEGNVPEKLVYSREGLEAKEVDEEYLSNKKVDLHTLTDMNSFMEHARDNEVFKENGGFKKITQESLEEIARYLEDEERWHKENGYEYHTVGEN